MSDPSMFSDTQVGAICGVLAAFGGSVIATARWAVARVVKALDESGAKAAKQAEEFVRLQAKVDEVHDWMQDHTPVEELRRASTPIRGVPTTYAQHRKRTEGE